jgi:hypothetical protein
VCRNDILWLLSTPSRIYLVSYYSLGKGKKGDQGRQDDAIDRQDRRDGGRRHQPAAESG